MNRAVICARVSTAQQAEQGRSIESQLAAMRQYVESIGATVSAELIDDVSGTVPIRERPGGRELYRHIDDRSCEAVVFYTVDRVTRDEDLIEINVIRRDCRNAGIELHYAADGGQADLSTWGGVIDTLKAAGAAEERKKIVERNSRGRRAKALAGRWVGAGVPPFGYVRTGSGRQSGLAVQEDEAVTVRRIFDLFLGRDGRKPMGIRTMTERFTDEGVPTPGRPGMGRNANTRGWHQRSIHMILTREMYVGVLTYGDVKVDAPHLAIVDRATFDAAQEQLKRNAQTARRRRRREYLLIGHLRCTCGRAMTARAKKGSRYRYYYCAGRSLPKHLRNCSEPLVNAELIEPAVWDWIERITTDEDTLAAAIEELARRKADDIAPKREELARLDRDIEVERRAIGVWVAEYPRAASDDELVDLKANVKAASARLEALRKRRTDLAGDIEQGAISHARRHDLLESVRVYREEIAMADDETRRYILARLHAVSRLRRDDAGLWADIHLQLDDEPAEGYFATTALRTSPPATPARCCDSPPAPRSPGGRSA